jgi:hypothetical protein
MLKMTGSDALADYKIAMVYSYPSLQGYDTREIT